MRLISLLCIPHALAGELSPLDQCDRMDQLGHPAWCLGNVDTLWPAVVASNERLRWADRLVRIAEGLLPGDAFWLWVDEAKEQSGGLVSPSLQPLIFAEAALRRGDSAQAGAVLIGVDPTRVDPGLPRELGLIPSPYESWLRVTDGSLTVAAKHDRICGMPLASLARRRSEELATLARRLGLGTPPAMTMYAHRPAGVAMVQQLPLLRLWMLNYAEPWGRVAYWSCEHTPLHELVHVLLYGPEAQRIPGTLNEGFAVALDGTRRDYRSERVADYADALGSVEDIFRAGQAFPGWFEKHGRLPVHPYRWYGLFAAFLLETQGENRLGPALPAAGDITTLVRAFGLEPVDAIERYKRWLRSVP